MKRRFKNITAMLLIVCICAGSFSASLALGKTSGKEEVVYSNLLGDGSVEKIYVVNIFNVTQSGMILDYGNYSRVLNLTDTSPVTLNGRKILINSSAPGRFYYQGYLNSLDLPWKISVTYSLDGKSIPASELAGASGNLRINIKTTQNENVDTSFFKKYMLQMSVTLNTEKCANIVSEGATIANVGKNKQLTFMFLPGSDGNATITSDVINFEMEGISINGVSFKLALDSGLIDSSQFAAQFGELTAGVLQLYDGAVQLENGAGELSGGLTELTNGTKRLASGSSALNSGMAELAGGISTLTKSMDDMFTTVSDMLGEGDELEKNIETIADALLADANSELKKLYGDNAPVMTWMDYREILLRLAKENNNQELEKMLTELDSTDAMLDKLTEGVTALKDSGKKLNDGMKRLNNGAKQLASATAQLNSGINELNTGAIALDDGALTLYEGMKQLRAGIGELKDGTSGIDGEVEDTISTMLNELAGEDFVPTSFTARINDNVSAVQFVLKTESIKLPLETTETPTQKTPSNFWERLLDLFGLYEG